MANISFAVLALLVVIYQALDLIECTDILTEARQQWLVYLSLLIPLVTSAFPTRSLTDPIFFIIIGRLPKKIVYDDRLTVMNRVLNTYGHLPMPHLEKINIFLIHCNMAPTLISFKSQHHGISGRGWLPVDPTSPPGYVERFV